MNYKLLINIIYLWLHTFYIYGYILRKHILPIEPLDKLGTMCHSMKLYEMVILLLSYSHQ